MANESVLPTFYHIARVRELLGEFAIELIRRGDRHDRSKLFDPEKEAFDAVQLLVEKNGQTLFGTPEYEERRKLLGPALEHHYAYNSHHPEHYAGGVSEMDLFDLLEMFVDGRAANEQRDGGEPMNLSKTIEQYRIDPMLAAILRNTAARLGWGVK